MKRTSLIASIAMMLVGCSANPPYLRVEWATASEVDTAGFNIYRSENPDGPFIKVNPGTIPALMHSLVGGAYLFEDRDIEYDKAYYYLLEDIETNGRTERHGPISATLSSFSIESLLLVFGSIVLVVGMVGTWSKQIFFHQLGTKIHNRFS